MKNKKPAKKRNIVIRFMAFLLSAAVILAAVGVVIFRDRLNMDALRRWFTYRSLSLNDSGQAQSFDYSGSADDVFADVDGDLLVCTGNAILLYSGSGTRYVNEQVSMSAPAVSVSGDRAVVYDAGGTALRVIRRQGVVFSLDVPGSLLSAHLSGDGLLTVVSQESGYRGVVTVYDSEGEVRAALRLSSTYVMDALLSDDGTSLWVVTVGQESGSFASTLSLYDLNSVTADEVSYGITPILSTPLGSSVILALEEKGSSLLALGDTSLQVLDGKGKPLGSVDWSDRYLKGFSLAGSDFSVALLSRYRAGTESELRLTDDRGVLKESLSLNEQVLSLDAAGKYFAVLTADRLDLYTSDCTLYSSLSGTQGAKKVLLRSDGTAMLISADSARLYVPS